MAGVDNRIVTMKFDNAQFEQGARTSMSTLEKLKQGMNFGTVGSAATSALGGISNFFAKFGIKNPFSTAQKGAADLGKEAAGVTTGGLSALEGGVTAVSGRFIAMSTIAITALSNITNRAINAGTEIAKALTVDPIKMGLEEYELNMNSIQTILANTQVSGADLGDVNSALDELNEYSDKTIYNFAEMAKNIGTFTAAGVDLDTSVASIKGIANLAALSGSNSQQAATAMYQLSQEISAGRVSLMGWNSVVNAGMGGTTFQRALAQTAVAQGDIAESAVKLEGKMKNVVVNGQSFRDSIMAKPGEQSWLSSDVLLKTLKQFTGDMSDAELKAQGFNAQQIKDIKEMAKTAQDAATKVKTLKQVYDVAKETAQSGWSQSFRLIFGDFEEAKKLFTDFSNYVNGFLSRSADARNKLLGDWKKLGGRDALIDAFKFLGKAVERIMGPIRRAMADIFPPMHAQRLRDLSFEFRYLMKQLIPSKATMKDIRDIAGGLFAVLSIGKQILFGVFDGFKAIFDGMGAGQGTFLDFLAGIGRMIKEFDTFLKESGVITTFFTSLGGVISVPLQLLTNFLGVLGSIFSGFDAGGAGKAIGTMNDFGGAADGMATGVDRVMAVFEGLGEIISGVSEMIANALSKLGYAIAEVITPETFAASLDVINTALLGGIVVMLRKFFSGGLNVDVGGGFFSSITEAMGAATGVLQDMQTSLKADILLKIAGALGVMALSLLLLASIKSGDLTKALAAMSVGFAVLGGVMVALIKYIGPIGAMKLPLISAAMIGLASALLILSLALKVLGSMHPLDIAQGLIAIGLSLAILVTAAKAMSKDPAGMIRAAVAIGILAVALNILAVAMKVFATMSWDEMIKGLAGIAGALTAVAVAMKLMPKGILLQAAGILILSAALNALAVAMKIFATLSWIEMARGAVALGGALTIIALAMRLMPKSLVFTAAGLVLVAVALNGIASALLLMGGSSWEAIGKGLVTLGGALLILALGLNAMGPMALIGAAALTVATAALMLLTPVLITLGSLEWITIIKSLTALAGIFAVLGLAGLILAPVVPVILALSVALVGIGAGLALAGVGALAFATAFGVIVATGMAGVQILAGMLGTIIKAIPGFFAALGQGLGRMAGAIAKNGPQFTRAMNTILDSMLKSITKNVPRMGRAFLLMLETGLKVVLTATPKIVAAGFKLIIDFLSAIEKNIGRIVDIAARIIVNFVNGLARNVSKIIQSGVNLIIKFIEGVTRALNQNSEKLGEAGGDLAVAIVRGMATGISAAAGQIKDAAVNAAKDALQAAKDWLLSKSPSKRARDELGKPVSQGMAIGIKDEAGKVANEAVNMGRGAVDALKNSMSGMSDALELEADMRPVIAPVLDLTALSQEANKMSSILATAPIMAGVSYQTAADISAMTQASAEVDDDSNLPGGGGRGDQYVTLEQHLHSPKPIDSVEAYRGGKSLISLAKETLS